MLIKNKLPTENDWHKAFLESWHNVKKTISEPQPFFLLSEQKASDELIKLAEATYEVCKQNERLFKSHVIDKLEEIDRHIVDGYPAKKSTEEKKYVNNLPYKSIGGLFKGREEALGKLEKELGGGKVAAITQTHAIHGLGGIGKTRLVVEFGWRLLEAEKVRAVLFVVADNLLNYTSNMAKLAGVGLLNLEERKLKDELAVVEAVVGHLAGRDDYLVIFDNVDDEEARKRVSEIVPRLCKGRVIITSRMGQWSGGVKAVAIDKLSEKEAVSYLLEKTQEGRAAAGDDGETAGRLAEKLDGLPIALEQAAAYINRFLIRICTRFLVQGAFRDSDIRPEYS
jgi:hypothetical protein